MERMNNINRMRSIIIGMGERGLTMPSSPLRPCSYPGCSNLVRSGRCDQHPYPDAHIREHQKLYDTRRWKRIRARQLAKEPWCADCLKDSLYTPATIVDHIEPHRGDPVKFFAGPLQSLCKPCHDRKTNNELRPGRART